MAEEDVMMYEVCVLYINVSTQLRLYCFKISLSLPFSHPLSLFLTLSHLSLSPLVSAEAGHMANVEV